MAGESHLKEVSIQIENTARKITFGLMLFLLGLLALSIKPLIGIVKGCKQVWNLKYRTHWTLGFTYGVVAALLPLAVVVTLLDIFVDEDARYSTVLLIVLAVMFMVGILLPMLAGEIPRNIMFNSGIVVMSQAFAIFGVFLLVFILGSQSSPSAWVPMFMFVAIPVILMNVLVQGGAISRMRRFYQNELYELIRTEQAPGKGKAVEALQPLLTQLTPLDIPPRNWKKGDIVYTSWLSGFAQYPQQWDALSKFLSESGITRSPLSLPKAIYDRIEGDEVRNQVHWSNRLNMFCGAVSIILGMIVIVMGTAASI